MNLMNSRDLMVFSKPTVIKNPDGYYFRTYEDDECSISHKQKQQTLGTYTDNEEFMIDCGELEKDYEIQITKSGKFLTEIHAANYFIPFIVGNKGSKKKKIELTTKTTIKLPKSENDNIIILGSNQRDVASARNRIYMIILEMRERHRMTHFVSIRIFSSNIKENFEKFKMEILNGPICRGIHTSIFQKPEKLHLTIAPLIILDDYEIEAAINALHDCKNEILKPMLEEIQPPLLIHLEGIEIMNDDPTEVDILYGKVKVDPSRYQSVFQTLVDEIVNYFYQKGFIKKQYDSVKLHVTLMNTLFRKDNTNKDERNNSRESFDASNILQKYKDFYFGEVELDFIHLSIRFSKTDHSGDYYYEALTTIPFF